MLVRGFCRLPVLPPRPFLVRRCRPNREAVRMFPKFISLEDDGNIKDNSSGSIFRIVSYNILAQAYVKSSFFPHSPRPCLKWKARSHAILAFLKSFDADFICLQELDELESFYRREMEEQGYLCVYLQRPGQKRDGCGIFYKHESAELLLMEEIKYNDIARCMGTEVPADYESTDGTSVCYASLRETLLQNLPNGFGDLHNSYERLKRDCVGLLTAFKLKAHPQHLIIVVNTHIYWDPEWIDVKLAQVEYLLLRLVQFKKAIANKFKCIPAFIIAGDFNSTPGDKVYQRLVSNTNSCTEAERMRSSIPLASLYASTRGEPIFTNCTPDFSGTLDYIFFSNAGNLKPVSFLEVPGPDSIEVAGGLPNYHHPSDHLPIGADFRVIS